MKLEFDLPDELTEKPLAIVQTDVTEVIGYINVYEKGDCWIKINSCKDCKNTELCCRGCPMGSSIGCMLHMDGRLNKPHHCVVDPLPSDYKKICQLEFKELKSGKIRKASKPKDIFD